MTTDNPAKHTQANQTKPAKARLYFQGELQAQNQVVLEKDQAHYVVKVLRSHVGDGFGLFNAQDGEWYCQLVEVSKSKAILLPLEQTKPPKPLPPLTLAFAPLRKERMSFLIEKATELGATNLQPFVSDFTNWKFNSEKMQKVALEAAEQCERLDVPVILPSIPFQQVLNKPCLLALERGEGVSSLLTLPERPDHPVLVIGPEGGFSPNERKIISQAKDCIPISLGDSILRAETAGLVGLALLQALRT